MEQTSEKKLARSLRKIQGIDGSIWQPEFYHPTNYSEHDGLLKLIEEKSPFITDEITDQVKELVKLRMPTKKRWTPEEIDEAIATHFAGHAPEEFGVWVYYPWSNRLVHLLPEHEFIEVRTNRNHYKISLEEEEILAKKKVGLIGLSVGQSVAVTMAMERGFGELRIADFDELELTNLNRIRTGVHNLGIKKVISVAREIMEIDPFLKLKCFSDGLTEENMNEFFEGGGKLDLLIDECDGLDMKVLARWKARELQIPVVMEASDRGMVDVERFDLEPKRPLLHGMIEDLNPEKLKSLETNEDKIPYMLDIVGLKTISTPAKASMLEIGETITTWPQLASAVTLGGGITADVVRRIFLDKFHESGRYYMDVEEIIGNTEKSQNGSEVNAPGAIPDEDFGPAPETSGNIQIPSESTDEIIKAACHAPSGGNLQPWKWTARNDVLQLKFDRNLISSFLDHSDIASMIALGASIENAALAAHHIGLNADINYFPDEKHRDVVARIRLNEGISENEIDDLLSSSIYKRETNRKIEPGPPLPYEDKELLKSAAIKNGSELLLLEKGEDFDQLSGLIAFAERFRLLHPTGHKNFIEEMRWSKEEAESTRDGIDIRTVDLTIGELTGFQLAREREVIEKLIEWKGGKAFERLSKKATGSAAALGIITRGEASKQDYLKGGRDMERVWIAANASKIGFQPQSPLSLLLPRLKDQSDLNEKQARELEAAGVQFRNILNKYGNPEPIFIFRLFKSESQVVRSLRRDLNLHYRRME